MSIRLTFLEKLGQWFMHLIMVSVSIFALYPVVLTFMVSISSERSVVEGGFRLIPLEFSMEAYNAVFASPAILRAYLVTISVTAVGTTLTLLLCSMAGWALSCERVRYRNALAMFFYIPMVFSAGLVPWYLLMTQTLQLRNSFWAMIIPSLVSPFNLFLLRNYMRTISISLIESAQMDGASVPRIYLQVVMPLAKPILATCGLFISLSYWNSWSEALWLISDPNLFPLQFMLFRIQDQLNLMRQMGVVDGVDIPTNTFRIATMFVTIGPIVLIYPFVQRYFVKGIMIGAIKG